MSALGRYLCKKITSEMLLLAFLTFCIFEASFVLVNTLEPPAAKNNFELQNNLDVLEVEKALELLDSDRDDLSSIATCCDSRGKALTGSD
uniref:Uncharacterized protein n=1 Tax=Romanomermis culicivorax TaxID=13658 RepID=A0A915JRA7_ROMCU